jgi:hypothetical protein
MFLGLFGLGNCLAWADQAAAEFAQTQSEAEAFREFQANENPEGQTIEKAAQGKVGFSTASI